MSVGETLLKVSDYPFAYSVAVIVLRANNIHLNSTDAAFILAAAGFFGTVLAVLDPFGKLFKQYLMDIEKYRYQMLNASTKWYHRLSLWIASNLNPKLKNYQKVIPIDWSYLESSFHTRAIEVEKDKIVSMFYFLFIVSIILILISTTNIFEDKYPVTLKNNPICGVDCAYFWAKISVDSIALLIAMISAWNGAKVIHYATIVSTYLFGISSQAVSKNSVENMSKFIESGDWKTAEYWKNIVETEYNNEDGLQKERNEKLIKHVHVLLESFNISYSAQKKKNMEIILDLQNTTKTTKTVEEILKEFEWYDSLIQHLYTTKNNDVFSKFKIHLEVEIGNTESYDVSHKKKLSEIEDIIDNLGLEIRLRTPNKILGDDGQMINMTLLLDDLDNFVYETSREELIPVERYDATKWYVRFYDKREFSMDDRVALLKEPLAEKFSIELANLALKLRKSDIYKIGYESRNKALYELENAIEIMLKSHQVNASTLNGSCLYCRNAEFFSKKNIELENEKMKEYPSQLFDKNEIYTAHRRKKINKSAII